MKNRNNAVFQPRIIIVMAAASAVCGCASTETFLRSQPSTHFPSGTDQTIALDGTINSFLKVHCLQASKIKYTDKASGTGEECLYISADVSALPSAALDATKRLAVVGTLLSISDLNCSTFLHRAFANRAGLDYTKTLSQDLATAASAGTAFVSAPAAAALSASNLVIGKGIDTFNATYYQQQTFQAMESAIEAARQQELAVINTHESDSGTYTTAQALLDIRAYDDACSFKNGLAKLNEVAVNAKNKSKDLNDTVHAAPTTADKNKALKDGQASLR